jgi:hypothetical protein
MLHFLLANPSSSSPPNNTVWIMIALAGVVILYAVFRPSMRNKKDPLARPPGSRGLAQQRSTERQMETLLVELSEMARQITAQLDTRSQKLEMLIREADEKIAALQRAKQDGVGTTTTTAGVSPGPSEVQPHRPDSPAEEAIDPRHQEVYALADQGAAAPDIARQLNRPRGEVELILALRPRRV